jgi:thioredoxin 1
MQLEKEDDKELEKIRRAKLQEMLKKSKSFEEKTVIDKPVEVTDATFNETVQSHPLVVIDCWAVWCGPCRMIAPIIEELARKYAGRVVFGKLDVDKNRAVSMQYHIVSIPTMMVFSHGKLVDSIIGALPKPVLEAQIARYLDSNAEKRLG